MTKTQKRISILEDQVKSLWRAQGYRQDEILEIREELKEPHYLSREDCIPENSHLSLFGQILFALMNYLNVEKYQVLEDDPSYSPLTPTQRSVYKIRKKK